MNQYDYQAILACIEVGAPALAPQLTTAFNNVMKLANDQTIYLQTQQQIAEQKAAAAVKKKKN